ncbi:MAG TPA: hypothetical protein VMF90_25055 [Rhizobiaceae bacterium]|nr:hypothetical protein [Rhizobiaceae bacterium]
MRKTFNRMAATFGALFTSERSRRRTDRFIAWLAGANHERSMNG